APPVGMGALAGAVGLPLNEYGFVERDAYQPVRTERPGLFVAGACGEPKDIPETVAEAAGAAAVVAAFVQQGAAGGEPVRAEEPGEGAGEAPWVDAEPRLGVFVCSCNGELSALGPKGLAAWAGALPGVALARTMAGGCSAEGRAEIQAV
ncbi:MAG: hypothetical protein ACK2U9_07610, partial [Anaerolineae bacterium]